jgi:hypothetical protein
MAYPLNVDREPRGWDEANMYYVSITYLFKGWR